ncbi:MAG: hypothetical protein JEZ14_11800 [Marinilabiliaceae bacterium]|nr:hypothetical protein [Marinilabiliaceae bacterium]
MQLTTDNLNSLCQTAISAALTAGQLISDYTGREIKVENKTGGSSLASQVVTEVDLLSQQCILEIIEPTCKSYDLALLTEESADDHSRLEKDYFWCIDPLDGTLPFTESTPGYAVSIALVTKAGIPQIGVVYDPVKQTLYHAIKGHGAYRNQEPWLVTKDCNKKPLTLITDRSFLKHPLFEASMTELKRISNQLGCTKLSTIHHGGAAMNALWVLENSPACYFKYPKPQDGGGSLWDYAATACVFHEMGAAVSDIHGDPLELNRVDSTFMNHRGVLFAHTAELAIHIQTLYQQLVV